MNELKSAVKNWWVSLIIGILFVAMAIWMMFDPKDTYAAISIVFSIMMFASGILEITFAVSNKDNLSGWGWYLAGGIIDLLMGLILICLPVVSMAVIPFLIAFWLMFRGFSAAGFSLDLQRYGSKDWGWYLVFGILAIICSVSIIWVPAAGALTAVYMTSFAFMFIGIFRIMLAFELKKLHNNVQGLNEKLNKIKKQLTSDDLE